MKPWHSKQIKHPLIRLVSFITILSFVFSNIAFALPASPSGGPDTLRQKQFLQQDPKITNSLGGGLLEGSLGAQVANIKSLDNLLRILHVLKKSDKWPAITDKTPDWAIVQQIIFALDKLGLIEVNAGKDGVDVVKIADEAKETDLGIAIQRWVLNSEGGVQAINFRGGNGIWKILGFESNLTPEVLEHEKTEVGFRQEGKDWVEAHNLTVDKLGNGEKIDPEEAKKYAAGQQDVIGAAGAEITTIAGALIRIKELISARYDKGAAEEIKAKAQFITHRASDLDTQDIQDAVELIIALEKDTTSDYAKYDKTTLNSVKDSCFFALVNTAKNGKRDMETNLSAVYALRDLVKFYLQPESTHYNINDVKLPNRLNDAFGEITKNNYAPQEVISAILSAMEEIAVYLYNQEYPSGKDFYYTNRQMVVEGYIETAKDIILGNGNSNPSLAKNGLDVLEHMLVTLRKNSYPSAIQDIVDRANTFLYATANNREIADEVSAWASGTKKRIAGANPSRGADKGDLGAQVSNVKSLKNLVRILNLLRKSKKWPTISESTPDYIIIEQLIYYLENQGLVRVIPYLTSRNIPVTIVLITDKVKETKLGTAIKEWVVGGVKAINFRGADRRWKIVGFESDLALSVSEDEIKLREDVLEHETMEVNFREDGISWVEAHNLTVEKLGKGQIISPEEEERYEDKYSQYAGLDEEIGAAASEEQKGEDLAQRARLAEGETDFARELRGDVLPQAPVPDVKAMADEAIRQADQAAQAVKSAPKAPATEAMTLSPADDESQLFIGGGYGFPLIARNLVDAAKRGDEDLNQAVQQAIKHFEGDQEVGVTYGADEIIKTIHEMADNDTDRELGQKIIARFTVAYVKPNFSATGATTGVPVTADTLGQKQAQVASLQRKLEGLREQELTLSRTDEVVLKVPAYLRREELAKIAQRRDEISAQIEQLRAEIAGSAMSVAPEVAPIIPISQLLAELAPEVAYAKNVVTALDGLEQRNEDNAVVLKMSNKARGSMDKDKMERLVNAMKQNGWKIKGVEFVDISPNAKLITNSDEVYIVADEDIEALDGYIYNVNKARVIAIEPLTKDKELVAHKVIFAALAVRNINQNEVKEGNPRAEAVISLLNELNPESPVNISRLNTLVSDLKTLEMLKMILKDTVGRLPTPVATLNENTNEAFENIVTAVGYI